MIVVVYDPATGAISQTMQGSPATVGAFDQVFPESATLEVAEYRTDYALTHRVEGGALQPISNEE